MLRLASLSTEGVFPLEKQLTNSMSDFSDPLHFCE